MCALWVINLSFLPFANRREISFSLVSESKTKKMSISRIILPEHIGLRFMKQQKRIEQKCERWHGDDRKKRNATTQNMVMYVGIPFMMIVFIRRDDSF